MKGCLIIPVLILSISTGFGQKAEISDYDSSSVNWYNKDLSSDNILGSSIDKAYTEILNDLTPKKIVTVAVIDGGVDIHHKDLEGRIWINEDEIPDNGIDDDKNGYIDDIHGWNFIGNKSGENIFYENLEITRIVKSKDVSYSGYAKAKELYDLELAKRQKHKENYENFKAVWERSKKVIKDNTGIIVRNQQDLTKVNSNNEDVINAKNFLNSKFSQGVEDDYIDQLIINNSIYLDYYLNLNFEPRDLVGDDPLDFSDKFYGNNDVKGIRSNHGTSVAGIIAAKRNNGIGIDGVVDNVRLMILKSTPKGDERDKDVALSIMYAVDNGADIINMSFGKDLSPQKEFVDIAVQHAEENGVLIIHSAGNNGQDLDKNEKFPSDIYLNGSEPSNWLNVGATQSELDNEVIGRFSNYGLEHVDIYAPGVDLISLDSSNTYNQSSGTSIAAPVASGIAALILSYYPELTPQELITILIESSYKIKKPKKVLVPGLSSDERDKMKFSTLSKSGGVINAYDAFKYIQEDLSVNKK